MTAARIPGLTSPKAAPAVVTVADAPVGGSAVAGEAESGGVVLSFEEDGR